MLRDPLAERRLRFRESPPPMTDEPFDPPPDQIANLAQPADRDERRVLALQRFMRRALDQERRVGIAAVRKITEAFRGNSREE
jgi:hypothetical protein